MWLKADLEPGGENVYLVGFFYFSFKEEDNEWACEFLQGQNEHPAQTGMVALLLNAYAVWAEVGKVNKCDSHQISVWVLNDIFHFSMCKIRMSKWLGDG